MSANSAVTVLRSPSSAASGSSGVTRTPGAVSAGGGIAGAAAGELIAAPQAAQKFAPTGLSAPHRGQAGVSRFPH